jgi:hypothetical protein
MSRPVIILADTDTNILSCEEAYWLYFTAVRFKMFLSNTGLIADHLKLVFQIFASYLIYSRTSNMERHSIWNVSSCACNYENYFIFD